MTSGVTPFSRRDGMTYGLLGLPLAFVALPLYVLLPNHYAREFGVPLATLGAVLLAVRLLDAFVDPMLGRLSDWLFNRSAQAVLASGALAALLLAVGLAGLFFPGVAGEQALVAWAAAFLLLTYAGYSQLGIAHQSWGARLGGDELQRGRIVAWREGFGLAGVLLAATLPALLGFGAMLVVFAASLVLGWLAWTRAPRPAGMRAADEASPGGGLLHPWRHAAFRRLLAVFMLNGIAGAIPATLVLFFVQDRLRAPPAQEPLFLIGYFLCAAGSISSWLAAVKRWGLARSWLGAMLLSIAVFGWAAALGEGDAGAFLVVCALSGAALGADLALPAALLAGVIAGQGESRHAGAYFGWWNFATKLNLALAAGLVLPLLGWFGYRPGAVDVESLRALGLAYAVLPCLLKLLAAAALYLLVIRPSASRPDLLPEGRST